MYIAGKFNPNSIDGIKAVIREGLDLDIYWADDKDNERLIIQENNIKYLIGKSIVADNELWYLYRIDFAFDEEYNKEVAEYKRLDTFDSKDETIDYILFKDRIIRTKSDCKDFLNLLEDRFNNDFYGIDTFGGEGFTFKDFDLTKEGHTTIIPKGNNVFMQYSRGQGWSDQNAEMINKPIDWVWKKRKGINEKLRKEED